MQIFLGLICVQTVVKGYLQPLAVKGLMIIVLERGYYLFRMDHWSKFQIVSTKSRRVSRRLVV